MTNSSGVSANVIGQIALMQSVVTQLPDQKSMLSFVCKGLLDVPGVLETVCLKDEDCLPYTTSPIGTVDANERVYTIRRHQNLHAVIILRLSDVPAFAPYVPYIDNYCNMLAVVFEELRQRDQNRALMADLEQRVVDRTAHLQLEIEQRIRTEQELSYSNSLTNASLEVTADAVLIFKQDGSLARWNRQLVDLWHIPVELLNIQTGVQIFPYIAAQIVQADNFMQLLAELYNSPERSHAATLRLIDGRTIESYSRPVHIKKQVAGRFWSFRDISERRRIEHELEEYRGHLEVLVRKRTFELEDRNREIENFVYSISHDLRAPLRSISGFSQIIARRHAKSLNEEGQHYFDNIVQASERMGILIDELLNFSRLGRKAIQLEEIDLKEVLQTIIDTLQTRIEQENARIDVSNDLPRFLADNILIGQIFLNLIDNGIKYRRPDADPVISIETEETETAIKIMVTDNGIGIDPQFHQKIFQIFQRLHSDDDYHGTGIGLAIVKKAVEMMEGEVSLNSVPGQGSVFTVCLPRNQVAKR